MLGCSNQIERGNDMHTITTTTGHDGPWLEVARQMSGGQFDCHICEEPSAVRVVYTRLRWSRSRKRHIGETAVEFLCAEHMGEDIR